MPRSTRGAAAGSRARRAWRPLVVAASRPSAAPTRGGGGWGGGGEAAARGSAPPPTRATFTSPRKEPGGSRPPHLRLPFPPRGRTGPRDPPAERGRDSPGRAGRSALSPHPAAGHGLSASRDPSPPGAPRCCRGIPSLLLPAQVSAVGGNRSRPRRKGGWGGGRNGLLVVPEDLVGDPAVEHALVRPQVGGGLLPHEGLSVQQRHRPVPFSPRCAGTRGERRRREAVSAGPARPSPGGAGEGAAESGGTAGSGGGGLLCA